MKALVLLLAGWFVSTSATATETRLALWLTDPIGVSDGSQCRQPKATQGQPTLTERDVTAWDSATGRWTLSPESIAATEAGRRLQDRCFVLTVDGKPISHGIALSAHSERLIGFPLLSVIEQDHALVLQLSAGNHGGYRHPIHVDALDAVLGRRGEPGRPNLTGTEQP